MMRRLIACLLALCALSTAALADDFGQSYDLFEQFYADNIVFINENTGRHLLPHVPQKSVDSAGCTNYDAASGALGLHIVLDDLGSQIASCLITLTAPAGMQYGDSQHYDFTTAGYHSYALLMAMHGAETAFERYALVEEVNQGLAENGGTYETTVGDYRLTCTSENGVASMLFENLLLMTTTFEPETQETTPIIEIRE